MQAQIQSKYSFKIYSLVKVNDYQYKIICTIYALERSHNKFSSLSRARNSFFRLVSSFTPTTKNISRTNIFNFMKTFNMINNSLIRIYASLQMYGLNTNVRVCTRTCVRSRNSLLFLYSDRYFIYLFVVNSNFQ